MVSIADKIGKASIDGDYAVATTVKTARLSGVSVLEAFDLSKFATGTPVYFITYKKTTNPTTGVVSVTNQISWKALVNAGANTLTNLTLAPGYADSGNAVGDFIECVPTSYWGNSLADAILAHTNQDGTLKTSAVQAALNISAATSPDWTVLATPPSTVVYNGQRSYTVTIPAVNYTDRLNPGTRLQTVRAVAAPTQSTSLNGTTQYWVKTSPNKLTFTDDFVVSAWVKLTSYGTYGDIISRYNGTSGWELLSLTTGQIALTGYNGGSGNQSTITTYQSIPLNKWVHITAQLDMSTFTATPTTSYIMIDGIDVPSTVARTGTNPTALIQAGNLEIGSRNGGLQPFPGKIAQIAIFNAKVTQATMLTYMSQGLSGTETSLASAYSFNGVATDLNTTTPNDLTAQGSAVATNADSPFGTQASGLISSTLDYGIIQSATFSTNTTLVVQVPEGCTIPTSGGVSAVSYSSTAAPYGFPKQKDKWRIQSIVKTQVAQTSPVAGTWYNLASLNLSLPIGSWDDLGWSGAFGGYKIGSLAYEASATLSTANNSESDGEFTAFISSEGASATFAARQTSTRTKPISVSSVTPYYFNAKAVTATTNEVTIYGSLAPMRIYADNGYL